MGFQSEITRQPQIDFSTTSGAAASVAAMNSKTTIPRAHMARLEKFASRLGCDAAQLVPALAVAALHGLEAGDRGDAMPDGFDLAVAQFVESDRLLPAVATRRLRQYVGRDARLEVQS